VPGRAALTITGSTPAALALALVLDGAFGEPPEAVHPVVWMGRAVGALVPPDPPRAGALTLLRGGVTALGGAVMSAGAAGAVALGTRRAPRAVRAAVEGVELWPLLALRTLLDAAVRVGGALQDGDLPRARSELRWLVGRDRSGLDAAQVASAAIESVAENLADSVIAPLLYARVGGPAAAAAHRFANTADAMVGYRDRHLLGGRVAARLDDALGVVPARMCAALIAAAAPAGGGSVAGGLRIWRRDGGRTPSPNAGRPMAAMAGALGVRLEKPGVHVLNAGGAAPTAADIGRAVRITRAATALALGCTAVAPGLGRRVVRRGLRGVSVPSWRSAAHAT
jgi:adenosylcobinamide-phosphate synthase